MRYEWSTVKGGPVIDMAGMYPFKLVEGSEAEGVLVHLSWHGTRGPRVVFLFGQMGSVCTER